MVSHHIKNTGRRAWLYRQAINCKHHYELLETREKRLSWGSSRLTSLSFASRVRYTDGGRLYSQRSAGLTAGEKAKKQTQRGRLHPRWRTGRSQQVGRGSVGQRGFKEGWGWMMGWTELGSGPLHKGRLVAEQDSKIQVLPQGDTNRLHIVPEGLGGWTQRLLTAHGKSLSRSPEPDKIGAHCH